MVSGRLTTLAAKINQIHGDCEQALAIAQSAQQSALQHARRCGELLLQAKRQIPHGGWETWREANLQLSSSTASLYQRVAQNWERLEAEGVADLSLREADRLLRQAKEPPDKSATVADLAPPSPPSRDNAVTEAAKLEDSSGSGNRQRQPVPLTWIEKVAPSGWIQTKSGESLNPRFFEPEQPPTAEPSNPLQEAARALVRHFAQANQRRWDEDMSEAIAAELLQVLSEF
jgi:hypothetical protein